jgi:hypothetical protein
VADSTIINQFANGLEEDANGVVTPTYGASASTITQGNDLRLKTAQRVIVQKEPGAGQFSDINAALASITDASVSKPYVIDVGAGVYSVNTITMKPFVYIQGHRNGVVIEPDDPDKDLIIGAQNSGIYNCRLQGSTGAGRSLLVIDSAVNFYVFNCYLGDATKWATIRSNTGTCLAVFEHILGQFTVTSTMFDILSTTNPVICSIIDLNFTVAGSNNDAFLIDGPATTVRMLTVAGEVVSGGSSDRFIRIRNGAKLIGNSIVHGYFNNGIEAENVGASPITIEVAGYSSIANTTDIDISNANTVGFISGVFKNSKVNVVGGSTISISGADPDSSFYVNKNEVATKDISTVYVRKSPGPHDYSTIAEGIAAAAALLPSASNRIVIDVGAGVFTEGNLIVPSYVTVIGKGNTTTVVEVNDPDIFLFSLNGKTEVKDMRLSGGTNPSGGLVESLASAGTAGSITDCVLAAGYTIGKSKQATFGFLLFTGCFIDPLWASAGYAFDCEHISGMNIINIITSSGTINTASNGGLVNVSGPNCQVNLSEIALSSTQVPCFDHLMTAEDGATLGVNNVIMAGAVNCGICAPNVGAAPEIQAPKFSLSIALQYSIKIEHTSAVGSLFGVFETSNQQVDSPNIAVTNIDPNDTDIGLAVIGDILQGTSVQNRDNISRLLRRGSVVGLITGGDISITDTLEVTVSAGDGYLVISGDAKQVEFQETAVALAIDEDAFILVNTSGTVIKTPTTAIDAALLTSNMLIARVVTNSTGILYVADEKFSMVQHGNSAEEYLKLALGSVFRSGATVTENGTNARQLDMTSGIYYYGTTSFNPTGGANLNFDLFFRDGASSWNKIASQTLVPNDKYDDNSGTLANVTASYFTKHLLLLVGDGTFEDFFLVTSQAEYAALLDAENADLPLVPNFFSDPVVRVASIICQQGVNSIAQIRDERPRIGFSPSATSGSASHSSLLDLGSDDHTQYLLVSGIRAMSGNLDMGTNDIINAGTLNGVVIETHASRHAPNGVDPLAVAAPTTSLSGDTTNFEGIQNSFSRSDHRHEISTAIASSLLPNAGNNAGSLAPLSRADHIHNIPTAPPATITPDQANADGFVDSFSRSDHVHQIVTAAPAASLSALTTNGAGVASTFSKSDHSHAIITSIPSTQTPDQTNSTGTSNGLARADHIHNIPTAAPVVSLSATSSNGIGTASTFSRSDHSHAITTSVPSTQTPDQTNSTGASSGLARADHIHNIPTAVAVTLTPDAGNSQGSNSTFSRSDHVHNVPTEAPTTPLSAATTDAEGAAASFSRSDHSHSILTGIASQLTPDLANAIGTSANLARADHIHNIPTATQRLVDLITGMMYQPKRQRRP